MTYRLTSLALLAMLALVPINARAQSSPLTPDILNKLLQLEAQNGGEMPMSERFASALGFSPRTWRFRNTYADQASRNIKHVFGTLESEQDVLFSWRGPDQLQMYRVHRDGKIVRGVAFDVHTGQQTTLELTVAQREVDAEVIYWAEGLKALESKSK